MIKSGISVGHVTYMKHRQHQKVKVTWRQSTKNPIYAKDVVRFDW